MHPNKNNTPLGTAGTRSEEVYLSGNLARNLSLAPQGRREWVLAGGFYSLCGPQRLAINVVGAWTHLALAPER